MTALNPKYPRLSSRDTIHPKSHYIRLTLIFIDISSVADKASLSVNDKNLTLSKASEAFEINSRRKI